MKTIRSHSVTIGLVLSACFVLAVSWCVMAVPSPAFGKKPSGGGGGGGGGKKQEIPAKATFCDDEGDRVQSDLLGPYIKEKKAKCFIGLARIIHSGGRVDAWTDRLMPLAAFVG